jgi:F0F1-type ATP synthase membrane subunit a
MSIYAPLEHLGIPVVLQSALLAAALLLATSAVVRRHLGTLSDNGLVPDSGITIRNLLELGVGTLADLARDVIGDDYRRFMGLLLTLFTFVLVSNFLAPGRGPRFPLASTTSSGSKNTGSATSCSSADRDLRSRSAAARCTFR